MSKILRFVLIFYTLLYGFCLSIHTTEVDVVPDKVGLHDSLVMTPGHTPSSSANRTPPHDELARESSSGSASNFIPPASVSSEETRTPAVFNLIGSISDNPVLEELGKKIPLYFGDSLQEEIQKANQTVIGQLEVLIGKIIRGDRKLSKRVINVFFHLQKDGEITVEPSIRIR